MAKFRSKGNDGNPKKLGGKKGLGVKKMTNGKKGKMGQKKSFNKSKSKMAFNKGKDNKAIEKDEKVTPIKKSTNNFDKKRKMSFESKESGITPKKDKPDTKEGETKPPQEGKEIFKDLMVIYEQLRKKKTSKEDKHKLIERVFAMTSDKKDQVVFKHDTVRVLEACFKFGDETQRGKLFDLFKDNTIDLVVTEGYSKFLLKKFMEYGTKQQKSKIISSFSGKVVKLMKQKTAADILEELFSKYANAGQRSSLAQEFYGPEFEVYRIATGNTFEHMMENDESKRHVVLDYMKTLFLTLCQKDLILHGITHKALLAFFTYASDAQKLDLHEVLKEQLLHFLHTKEGAKVAMKCIWMATKKDRKSIIKSFKTFVLKICREEFGHLVLLALFDVIDDTVLVNKALFPELLTNIQEIVADQYGRKVILYLLKPRSPSYFLPDIVKLLQQGDENSVSKKSLDVRHSELRAFILPHLLKALSEHVSDILKNKSAAIVLLAALECADDIPEIQEIFEKISNILSEPCKDETSTESEEDSEKIDNSESPITDACGHWVIKSIVQQDKKRTEDNKNIIFSKILCDTVPQSTLKEWTNFNRGSFVLVSLVETNIESVKNHISQLKLPESNDSESNKGLDLLRKLIQ